METICNELVVTAEYRQALAEYINCKHEASENCEHRLRYESSTARRSKVARTMKVKRTCMFCRKDSSLDGVDIAAFERWQNGELIQHAFPDKSPAWRERLMNGTHEECFDAAFADPKSGD